MHKILTYEFSPWNLYRRYLLWFSSKYERIIDEFQGADAEVVIDTLTPT